MEDSKPLIAKHELTGIILAGGKSGRMGKDKGLCSFREKALVTYAIEVLQPICGRMIISANNVAGYHAFGYEVIPDEIPGIGPMGGLYSCLKHSSTKHNLVLSCDTPFVNTQLFTYLLQHLGDYLVVVPRHGDGLIEPLAAYYSKDILTEVEQAIDRGAYKLMTLLQTVKQREVAVNQSQTFFSGQLFHNLNTPDDLLRCE